MAWANAKATRVSSGPGTVTFDWSVWFKDGIWNNYGQMVVVTDNKGGTHHNERMGSLQSRSGRATVRTGGSQNVVLTVRTYSAQSGENAYSASTTASGTTGATSIIKATDFTFNEKDSTYTMQRVDFNITKISANEVVRVYNVNPTGWKTATHTTATRGYYKLTGLKENTVYGKMPGLAKNGSSTPPDNMRVSVPAFPKYRPIEFGKTTTERKDDLVTVNWAVANFLGNIPNLKHTISLYDVFTEKPITTVNTSYSKAGKHVFRGVEPSKSVFVRMTITGKYHDGKTISVSTDTDRMGTITATRIWGEDKNGNKKWLALKKFLVWSEKLNKWLTAKDYFPWVNEKWLGDHDGYLEYSVGGKDYCDKFDDMRLGECVTNCYYVENGHLDKKYRLQLREGFEQVVITNNGESLFIVEIQGKRMVVNKDWYLDITKDVEPGKNYITVLSSNHSFEINYIQRKKVF